MKPTETDTRKTLNTAFWNTVANVLSLIVGTAMVPLITRVLSPEELGIAATFISTRNTASIIVSLAIYAFVNHGLIDYPGRHKDFIGSVSAFVGAAVFAALVIALPFKQQIQQLLVLDDFLFFWLFPSMACLALYYIAYYFCIFKNKTSILFWIVLRVGPVAQVVSVTLAQLFHGYGQLGRVIGLDATYVVISIVLICYLCFGKEPARPRHILHPRCATLHHPTHPAPFFSNGAHAIRSHHRDHARRSGQRRHLQHGTHCRQSCLYRYDANSWQHGLLGSTDASVTARGVVRRNCTVVICLGVYLFMSPHDHHSRNRNPVFLPASYADTTTITIPLVAAMYFQFCYLFLYMNLEYYHKKAHWIAIPLSRPRHQHRTSDFALVPLFGYLSVSYITLVSYAILFAINYAFVTRLDVRATSRIPLLVGSLVFMVAFAFAMQALSSHVVVRYAIMVAMTVAAGISLAPSLGPIYSPTSGQEAHMNNVVIPTGYMRIGLIRPYRFDRRVSRLTRRTTAVLNTFSWHRPDGVFDLEERLLQKQQRHP